LPQQKSRKLLKNNAKGFRNLKRFPKVKEGTIQTAMKQMQASATL
jgi:hypothetical protein